MGDDQGRVILRDLRQGALDGLLGVAVQRGGRLIEDQDARPLEHGPGDGHALFLAAGELEPALPHPGLPAVREGLDKGPDMGHLRGPLDLGLGRLGAPVGQVVPGWYR